MFKKKEKPIKEKKVRTMKVGTHKKSVIALWVVLIARQISASMTRDMNLISIFRDLRKMRSMWNLKTVI